MRPAGRLMAKAGATVPVLLAMSAAVKGSFISHIGILLMLSRINNFSKYFDQLTATVVAPIIYSNIRFQQMNQAKNSPPFPYKKACPEPSTDNIDENPA